MVEVESQRVKSYVKEPEAFDGKNFKDFYRSVNLFILSNRKDFETDERKILFVLSFMTEGLAGSWAQNEIDAAMYDVKGEERVPPQWEDWTTFTKKMIVAFGDPLEKKTYQVKLEQLRQHGDTAEAFFVKFDLYRRLAGYQEEHDQYLTSLLEKAM